MLLPSSLRGLLVAALQDTPSLITVLGNADNVVEYKEEESGDLHSSVIGLIPPSILVFYDGLSMTSWPDGLWRQKMGIVIRAKEDPFVIAREILSGIGTGQSLALPFRKIHLEYSPMNAGPDVLVRHSIAMAEDTSLDYWVMNVSFSSRGTE